MRFLVLSAFLVACGGEVVPEAPGDAGTHIAHATTEASTPVSDAAASVEEEASCQQPGPAPDPFCPPGTRFICRYEDSTCESAWCSPTSGGFMKCTPYGDAGVDAGTD